MPEKTRPVSTTTLVEQAAEVPFYIPALGPATRPRRTLKHDDCFAVLDSHGDIGASPGGPDGIFCDDTRFLSRLELLLDGGQLLLLGSSVRDDNALLTVDLTNPDVYVDRKLVLAKDNLHIIRTFFVWNRTAFQRLRLHNHGDHAVSGTLSMVFGGDFADLFEVRGMRRARRGVAAAQLVDSGRVLLRYRGLDDGLRDTALRFEPAPSQLSTSVASYSLSLKPGASQSIYLTVECVRRPRLPAPPFRRAMRLALQERRHAARSIASVSTSNDIFNEVLCRSMADLAMLVTQTEQGAYPYAGIPWYSTTFGRDGIITAIQMLWCNPGLAKGVLLRLAGLQAADFDAASDAEPGKILHEMRGGEMAALREVPFALYYGSVDSTPLFVLLAGLYLQRTGDIAFARRLWPHVEQAIGWMDGPGDPDGDGFVEYHRQNDDGLVNQGWKDSYDSVFHADGAIAAGPIALCEVQGYVYAAKRLAAWTARQLGLQERANELDLAAQRLGNAFEEAFWCGDIGTYAIALDGQKRPCRVRTSNAGQVLFSGIASHERAATVVADMMRPSFFSGWGVRTVAREEARYNPMSYHNGSVWPHDNALIAAGCARYGHKAAAARILAGIFEAAGYMDLRRMPELYCGFQRGRGRGPVLYPVACSPQAWAAGAPFFLLQSCLGLEFLPQANEIVFRNPYMPPFLGNVTIRNLQIGSATIDVELNRNTCGVSVRVLKNAAQVRVSTEYA